VDSKKLYSYAILSLKKTFQSVFDLTDVISKYDAASSCIF